MAISPLNSVPKKNSLKHRVIVDLSFPEGLTCIWVKKCRYNILL
jgi:hypothetical protein